MLVKESLYNFKREQDPIISSGLGDTALKEKWLRENLGNKISWKVKWYIKNNGEINVRGDVNLSHLGLVKLPDYIQFYSIIGSFIINHNNLITLEGCPRKITGHFDISNNNLISLNYAPNFVKQNFICGKNSKQFTQNEVMQKVNYIGGFIYV